MTITKSFIHSFLIWFFTNSSWFFLLLFTYILYLMLLSVSKILEFKRKTIKQKWGENFKDEKNSWVFVWIQTFHISENEWLLSLFLKFTIINSSAKRRGESAGHAIFGALHKYSRSYIPRSCSDQICFSKMFLKKVILGQDFFIKMERYCYDVRSSLTWLNEDFS